MKKSKKTTGNLALIIILTVLVLLYWAWLFYMTQPATISNTNKHHINIIDIKVQVASHRGNDKLFILSNDCTFMLDTGWQNKDKSYQLAEHILADEELLTITVWKHFPMNIFSIYDESFITYQVIDLRSESNVYWNITNHNQRQKSERIVGTIAGLFLSSFAVVFNFFIYCGTRRINRGKENGQRRFT